MRWPAAAVAAVLTVHAGLLAWSACRHSPVSDEMAHLPAGILLWEYGRTDLYRVNPPLVKGIAAFPVWLAGPKTDWGHFTPNPHSRVAWSVGEDFVRANGERVLWYFILARWAVIPLSLLGGYVCFRWAGELYGRQAGVVAALLWSFSPMVLGHGALITPDVGAAALGVAAGYLFWRWLRFPLWETALAAGLALGLAELAKMTWIILFALWPLLAILWTAWRGDSPDQAIPGRWRQRMLQVSAIAGIGLLVLNAGYGFHGSMRPLGSYTFVSESLAGSFRGEEKFRSLHTGNRFRDTVLRWVPVPVPDDYLHGLDIQKRDFEQQQRCYLGGQWKRGGWWYYYLYAFGVKVPLGLLLLFAIRIGGFLSKAHRRSLSDKAVLLCPAAAVIALVSSQTGMNAHFRYVLPAFPFLFVWASAPAQWSGVRPGKLAVAALACVTMFVAGSLRVYPHNLSYFNEFAGGPENGHRHLVGTNIDWGQDLPALARWRQAHPEVERLDLAYCGLFDPHMIGLDYHLPPPQRGRGVCPPSPSGQFGPHAGWYAVSVNFLRGEHYFTWDGQGRRRAVSGPCYRYFQHFEPVATAGYSINIYHITNDEAKRVRRILGLPEKAVAVSHAPHDD